MLSSVLPPPIVDFVQSFSKLVLVARQSSILRLHAQLPPRGEVRPRPGEEFRGCGCLCWDKESFCCCSLCYFQKDRKEKNSKHSSVLDKS